MLNKYHFPLAYVELIKVHLGLVGLQRMDIEELWQRLRLAWLTPGQASGTAAAG